MSNVTVFQIIGSIVMLLGIWLFIKDQRQADNKLKIGPVEISFSAPSIIFFIVGAALFCFPSSPWWHDPQTAPLVDTATIPPSDEAPTDISSDPAVLNTTLDLLSDVSGRSIGLIYCDDTARPIETLDKYQTLIDAMRKGNPEILLFKGKVRYWPSHVNSIHYNDPNDADSVQRLATFLRTQTGIEFSIQRPDKNGDPHYIRVMVLDGSCPTKLD